MRAPRLTPAPLPCQRALFDMPRDVAYLNAAAYGPLPLAVREAAVRGAAAKATPWTLDRAASEATAERVRAAAGALIGAAADDIAIVGSVSHALATAGRALPVPPGTRVLRVAGEQSSNCLEWARLAAARDLVLEVVPVPMDGDWTRAVVEAILRPGAPPVGLAALTPFHWTDGALIDLDRIAPVLRAAGAFLVVDATQAAGAMPIDVASLRPDFLAFPTYKWVLGSYNLAFLYAAPRWQEAEPLERNGFNCRTDASCRAIGFAPGARRYDMGERNNPVALPMAEAALGQCLEWGMGAVQERVRSLTDALAAAMDLRLAVIPRARRAANVLGLRLPGGVPEGLIDRLAASGVHVSDRNGVLRVSPHVYNDEADISRFAAALGRALG
jgi:selenocysteine lyase/cysteine desulfurase